MALALLLLFAHQSFRRIREVHSYSKLLPSLQSNLRALTKMTVWSVLVVLTPVAATVIVIVALVHFASIDTCSVASLLVDIEA